MPKIKTQRHDGPPLEEVIIEGVKCYVEQNTAGNWRVSAGVRLHPITDCYHDREAVLRSAAYLLGRVRNREHVFIIMQGVHWNPYEDPDFVWPIRLQLKGRVIPEGAVYVGCRPWLGGGPITDGTHYGNPFKVPPKIAQRAATYRGLGESGRDEYWALHPYFWNAAADFGFALMSDFMLQDRIKRELRGKDLVCHCHRNFCCHANILLKVANAEGPVYWVEILNVIGYETASPALKEAFAYGLRLRDQGLVYRPGLGWPARR